MTTGSRQHGARRKARIAGALCAAALFTQAAPSDACLWDLDTLLMERQRFPSALELITGKFLRHSEAFYRWRIQDRLTRIAAEPGNLALYDDLAAAHEKTGDAGNAIAVMLVKERLQPGKYETYANLGTFLAHSGDLENGAKVIDMAIQINPDAHFGREIYQKLLVEYVLSKGEGTSPRLPLNDAAREEPPSMFSGKHGFAKFIEGKAPGGAKAVKGVLGMMRFGRHDSPVLLEALGDLLIGKDGPYGARKTNEDAKQLAARAYLRASFGVKDPAAKRGYRRLAEMPLMMQQDAKGRPMKLAALEESLLGELDKARQWYAGVERDEAEWIAKGLDPEREFDRKYYSRERARGEPAPP